MNSTLSDRKKYKSIFGIALTTFMVAVGLFPAAGVAAAAADGYYDGMPSGTTTLKSSGWTDWIGTTGVKGTTTKSLHCGNRAISQISVRYTSQTINEAKSSETAIGGIGLSCSDGLVELSPGYGVTTISPSFNSYEADGGYIYCDDRDLSHGMYFTVGGDVTGLGEAIQGMGIICGDDAYYHSDDMAGLNYYSGATKKSVACALKHEAQAVQFQYSTTRKYPIIHAIRVKCG